MKWLRILIYEGDKDWIETTQKRSLKDGSHTIFGYSSSKDERNIITYFIDPDSPEGRIINTLIQDKLLKSTLKELNIPINKL